MTDRPSPDTRPRVTLGVFVFHQEAIVCQAIENAFAQTYAWLDIILSDD
ncbi:hypothetical protein FHS78_001924 [Parvibaculum indicum]|nr:hypothetical protein [Parvibaculum indicum]NIJ41634.1 hypothetical protein [Parvibaculum indicum]